MPLDSLDDSLSTSSSLIARVKRHEPQAWQRLVDLYSPLVYAWCRWTKLPAQDSADVMQDVFHAVVKGIDKLRLDRPQDSFRGWLYTITRNAANDHIAAQLHQPRALGGAANEERFRQLPWELADTGEIHAAHAALCRQALALLSAEFEASTWQAALAMIDGRPASEAARQHGMTAAAVRNAKYKVLRRLREELGEM